MSPSPLQIALAISTQGLPVFPVGRSKRPAISKAAGGRGFLDATADPAVVHELFARALHAALVGVPTGEISGLDVLDADPRNGAAEWLADNAERLPATRAHRTMNGGIHFLFRHAPGVRNLASKFAAGMDVRGDGGYVVFPPSVGYSVARGCEVAEWPSWLLELILKPPAERARPVNGTSIHIPEKRLRALMDAILARVQNAPDGGKHFALRNAALSIGGIQAAAGLSDDASVRMLLGALPDGVKDWKLAEATARWGIENGRRRPIELENRGEFKHRPRASQRSNGEQLSRKETADPYEGVKARGDAKPHPRAMTGTPETDSVHTLIVDFNARYCVVSEAGRFVIFEPVDDPVHRRRRYHRLTLADFRALHMNRRVRIETSGAPTVAPAAEVWLKHPDRRQFIRGVTFDPSGASVPDGVLNLWQGFAVEPRPGSWCKLRTHIRDVLCSGNGEHYEYATQWMARLLQFPAEQGEVAIVLRGDEGCGKGTLARALIRILGQHALPISHARHLTGNFNAHLRDCVFLFADEAFYAGDKQRVGVLKSLITEPYLTIEGKFQNAILAPNFLHVMMASNEQWVVPASLAARRFFVLDVGNSRRGDYAWFAAIRAELEGGGYEAMLHDLLNYDLTGVNLRAVPSTAGLQNQQKLSLRIEEAWWMDTLHRGYVWQSKLGLEAFFSEWHNEVSTDLLFASYLVFAERRRERHFLSREDFGRFMLGMGARQSRLRNAVIGEHIVDVPTMHGSSRQAGLVRKPRAHGYATGRLDLARDAFVRVLGISADWQEPAGEGDTP